MNRHDYGVIAKIIRSHRCSTHDGHSNAHIDEMVEDLIEYFAAQNVKFDPKRFRKAAGPQDG